MSDDQALMEEIQNEHKTNVVVIWSKSYCPFCKQTKALFKSIKGIQNIKIHELDLEEKGDEKQAILHKLTGQRTVPNVFINNQHIGGNDDVQEAYQSGALQKMISA